MTEPKLLPPDTLDGIRCAAESDPCEQLPDYDQVIDIFNHIAAQQARIEAIQRRVYEMLDAIENGAIDSAEIDLGDGAQPFKLHEEWAYYARRTISATPPPDPVREAAHELREALAQILGWRERDRRDMADVIKFIEDTARDALDKARPEAEG